MRSVKGLLKQNQKMKSSLLFGNIIEDEAKEIPQFNCILYSFKSISKEELLVRLKGIPKNSSSDNITDKNR